jgi:hypothetical protein
MQPTYLYLIEADGATKIGISNNPTVRLGNLQTGSPTPFDIRHVVPCPTKDVARKLEAYLHKRYDHTRVRGEWFNIGADEIYAEIELAVAILGSVAQVEQHPVVTRQQTIQFQRGVSPEITKGSQTIFLNNMAIPHYWLSFDESRAKPLVVGDDLTLVTWHYRRTFDLIKTVDSAVVELVKRATAEKLCSAYGLDNIRLVKQQQYAPYTLLEHAAQVGRCDSFGEFIRAA